MTYDMMTSYEVINDSMMNDGSLSVQLFQLFKQHNQGSVHFGIIWPKPLLLLFAAPTLVHAAQKGKHKVLHKVSEFKFVFCETGWGRWRLFVFPVQQAQIENKKSKNPSPHRVLTKHRVFCGWINCGPVLLFNYIMMIQGGIDPSQKPTSLERTDQLVDPLKDNNYDDII